MMFDEGSGPPLVVIPGVQGRWEWMMPALKALSTRCRVISYSLGSARTFDDLVAQVDTVLDGCGVATAAIVGVSFGGLVAVKYADARPERTSSLIVVAAPSRRGRRHPSRRVPWRTRGCRRPCFAGPRPDVAGNRRGHRPLAGADVVLRGHLGRIVTAPVVPAHMGARTRLHPGVELAADCARIRARALVITGEPELDQVVPALSTREFVTLISGARYTMMDRTGHIGLVTQPDRFGRIVGEFVNASRS